MTEYAYHPDPKPVCLTTVEQMQEKLERRKREIQEKRHGQQPEARRDGRDLPGAARLVWRPKEPGAVFVITECGKYTVDAARLGSGYRYSAWRRPAADGALPHALGCCNTPGEAKALCEAHLASTQTVSHAQG